MAHNQQQQQQLMLGGGSVAVQNNGLNGSPSNGSASNGLAGGAGSGGSQDAASSVQQPAEYTLAGILHYLQSEWRRYEKDRNEWEIERAEMRVGLGHRGTIIARQAYGN